MNRRLIWAIALGTLLSCGSPIKDKAAPAATVQHPVSESSLTTITLSAEAIIRLGIKTTVVDSGMVGPTRTVGGEVIVPPGQSLTIAAPTAGTVLPPDGRALPLPGARVARGDALLRLLPLPANQASVREAVVVALARWWRSAKASGPKRTSSRLGRPRTPPPPSWHKSNAGARPT